MYLQIDSLLHNLPYILHTTIDYRLVDIVSYARYHQMRRLLLRLYLLRLLNFLLLSLA